MGWWRAACCAANVDMGRVVLAIVLAASTASVGARADEVVVKVVGDGRTILERASCPDGPWDVVCFGPCGTKVPRDGWYRLIGARHTPATTLPAEAVEVTLGAPSDDATGLFMAAGGLVSVVAGGVVAWIGAFDASDGSLPEMITGTALVGTGLIAVIVGVFIQYEARPARLGLAVSF